MKTTLLAGTVGVVSLLGNALADETAQPTEAAAQDAAGVWYGVYARYTDDGPVIPRAGTKHRKLGSIGRRNATSEPIFVVLDLQRRDAAVTGTMKAGLGVRFVDPEAAMKRLFDIPVDEPSLPESRAVEGTLEGTQLSLTALPTPGTTEPVIEMTAEVDEERMRATLHMAADDEQVVRLERCDPDAGADDHESTADGTAESSAFCSVEAIWRRLTEEHGRPVVIPNQPFSRRR